jgi:DNA replication and repair protein RecF
VELEGVKTPSVARLILTDFRCYSHQRMETDPRPVVLCGPNGAGKTNLLEALSLLAPGRGLRRAKLSQLTRNDEADNKGRVWAVAVRTITPDGEIDIGTGLEAKTGLPVSERRTVHVDGRKAKSQVALADHLSVLWLTPQMDRLFQEGASVRRHFLDRLVFGFDQAHAKRLKTYEHAMRERSRILRNRGMDAAWLATLEETMSTTGVAIAAARCEVVERLNGILAQNGGPFPRARLKIAGPVEDWLEQHPALEAEERLGASLRRSRDKDRQAGGAAQGVHKSDMEVRHLNTNQKAPQCSTGEQKALLIAIVLAHARLQDLVSGAPPLLLLDEAVAHLDDDRRAALFDKIAEYGAQAWLTGTDEGVFSHLRGRAQFFGVKDAVIIKTDG